MKPHYFLRKFPQGNHATRSQMAQKQSKSGEKIKKKRRNLKNCKMINMKTAKWIYSREIKHK